MNIYLLDEDGVNFCIRAKSMSIATGISERIYIQERREESPGCDIDEEKKYYQEQILNSCSLIGELKND